MIPTSLLAQWQRDFMKKAKASKAHPFIMKQKVPCEGCSEDESEDINLTASAGPRAIPKGAEG